MHSSLQNVMKMVRLFSSIPTNTYLILLRLTLLPPRGHDWKIFRVKITLKTISHLFAKSNACHRCTYTIQASKTVCCGAFCEKKKPVRYKMGMMQCITQCNVDGWLSEHTLCRQLTSSDVARVATGLRSEYGLSRLLCTWLESPYAYHCPLSHHRLCASTYLLSEQDEQTTR